MVVHVPCLCYSRKGMELFYEKGEDKNGVLSYGIYRRNRRNCGKKSRFIAEVFPVSNEEEAFAHLEEIRKKHWDARHHCWAYVIGRNPAAERMSDDGEPAGTAGKPILEVLRGKKLTDVFVVVTRYFGGTLLGTGGLVRAYTSAAAEALAHTVIITKIHGFKLKIITDYTGLGKIQYILGQRGLSVLDTVYTDKVELTVLVPDDEEGFLMKELMEGTNGQAMTEKTEQCWFAETEEGIKIFEQ
ncbi:hypothetical protein HMPREF0990_01056 [Lachnospiraceae bacterium 1_1_57FAA]|nr:hypothetical protein HMPREF0990_01056 [Lachnospiraceae bacterium 1_1_57FAA]